PHGDDFALADASNVHDLLLSVGRTEKAPVGRYHCTTDRGSCTRSFVISAAMSARSADGIALRSNPRNLGPAMTTSQSNSYRRRALTSAEAIFRAKRRAAILRGWRSPPAAWRAVAPRLPGPDAWSKTR